MSGHVHKYHGNDIGVLVLVIYEPFTLHVQYWLSQYSVGPTSCCLLH